MKIRLFDVVKLKDGNKAIIKQVNKRNNYLAEIVNDKVNKLEKRMITNKEISRMLYSREKER